MTNETQDNEKPTKGILSMVLSLIGLGRSSTQEDDHSLYSSSSTKVASSASRSSSDESTLYNTDSNLMDESTVFVHTPLYDTWTFQAWLRGLPKLALFHLVSTMQDPKAMYMLLETQYRMAPTLGDTKQLNEIQWIQHHTRALVHQADALRPNEQFAQAKDIADQLKSMLQLTLDWGDAWLTVAAVVLVAQECLVAPAEIRQYLFYRVKLGQLMILKMNAALKHDRTPCQPQHDVAQHFFPTGWRTALEQVCHQLARLDEGWAFKDEYQQPMTLTANMSLD